MNYRYNPSSFRKGIVNATLFSCVFFSFFSHYFPFPMNPKRMQSLPLPQSADQMQLELLLLRCSPLGVCVPSAASIFVIPAAALLQAACSRPQAVPLLQLLPLLFRTFFSCSDCLKGYVACRATPKHDNNVAVHATRSVGRGIPVHCKHPISRSDDLAAAVTCCGSIYCKHCSRIKFSDSSIVGANCFTEIKLA